MQELNILQVAQEHTEGLVEYGFLKSKVLFFDHALTKSGTILLVAQSPPPITFPA